ncbi:hypothetical protein ES692_14950 [Psychroserpens burtonensis]|uniref:DUF1735 domain-containing protein n=1 Tax=Psychroserpens burtonensis TaxID=49278 RepID=A0A5C7B7W5_9FLAO|nr:hypothetical protein [Psychroserpens burtonensis]TXE15916.1 hypothetical protein ES692_14950 [Psychroserpens burtonensis]
MKKFKCILITILSAGLMISCSIDDNPQQLEADLGTTPYVVGFNNSEASPAFLTDGAVNMYSENIVLFGGDDFSTNPSITVNFEIDPTSTAVAGTDFDFVNGSQSVTIAEDREFAALDINFYSENINIDNPKVLILNIASADNNAVIGSQFQTLTITINGICFSDIGGLYNVTTTFGYHDFLPDSNPLTIDIEIEALGDGLYRVFDMSSGLYSSGLYADAYGTGPTSFDVIFSENCGDISWQGQTDGYGAVIPLEGGVNSVDEDTGVVTISWFCEAYGENGVSVYTPL